MGVRVSESMSGIASPRFWMARMGLLLGSLLCSQYISSSTEASGVSSEGMERNRSHRVSK